MLDPSLVPGPARLHCFSVSTFSKGTHPFLYRCSHAPPRPSPYRCTHAVACQPHPTPISRAPLGSPSHIDLTTPPQSPFVRPIWLYPTVSHTVLSTARPPFHTHKRASPHASSTSGGCTTDYMPTPFPNSRPHRVFPSLHTACRLPFIRSLSIRPHLWPVSLCSTSCRGVHCIPSHLSSHAPPSSVALPVHTPISRAPLGSPSHIDLATPPQSP